MIVLFAGSGPFAVATAAAAGFSSEDLLAVVAVVVVAGVAADNVEPAADLFVIGSNGSFVLAALEVFVVVLLLLLGPFALLVLLVLLLLLWPPAVVITGTDLTCRREWTMAEQGMWIRIVIQVGCVNWTQHNYGCVHVGPFECLVDP